MKQDEIDRARRLRELAKKLEKLKPKQKPDALGRTPATIEEIRKVIRPQQPNPNDGGNKTNN